MSTDQVTNAILSAGFQDLSYQISQPILNDNSTKSYEVKEIKEDSGNPTDALVPGSGTTASFSYVYPKSGALAVWKDAIIYLILKFTCTTSSEKATINICSDIRRIFGKVTTKINNTIESIIQDYGMTNYMVDILTKTRDVLMNSGIQGLYPDLAEDDGSMEDLRHAFIAGTSVTKAFMIPLGIPILSGNGAYLPGTTVNIQFERAPNSSVFYCGNGITDNNKINIEVSQMKILLPQVTPHYLLGEEISKKNLTGFSIAYPKYTIHRTTRKLSADDTFNFVKYKSIPAYVFIAFQPIGVLSNITAGTAHPDPCKFVDPGLLRISIEDGDKNTIPNEVHDLNIANGDFPFVYHDLMKCTKFFNDVVHGGIITRENFQTMYPIFAFKVRKNCAGLPELNNHECAINIHTILKPAAEGAPEQPQHVIWMLAAFDGVTTFNGSTGSATEEFGKD
ncbi:hypothetical protein PAPYR_12238 [Paratrimastix pyriformis]|uniref:Uncharacterized protein n=2 Tax=Paratrimastix pyriformis TaxID=342808 RepID=A0ABQ8U652_9EUKA|nr:hypothetical protein PAPYR_12238 [Paratrimastix pyriformis]